MRYRKIVTKVIFTVLILSLMANLGNIRGFAQDGENGENGEIGSIANLLQLSNDLENQYEEINTALRFRVNGNPDTELTEKDINELITTQDDLVEEWKRFCGHDLKSKSIPKNCKNAQNKEFAKQVNTSLEDLDKKVKPFFINQNTTILSIDRYKILELEYKPKNPNKITENLQIFLKKKLELEKKLKSQQDKDDPEQKKAIELIQNNIDKLKQESGVFYKETQKELKIVSTKESQNIENNLIEINKEIIAQQKKRIANNQGFVFGISPNIINGISGLLSLLTLAAISFLLLKKSKLSRDYQSIDDDDKVIDSPTPDIPQNHQNLRPLEAFSTGQANQLEVMLKDNNKTLLSELKKCFRQENFNKSASKSEFNKTYSKNREHQQGENTSIDSIDDLEKTISFNSSHNSQSQIFLDTLVSKYNKNPKKSVKNPVKVAATKESIEQRRSGIKTPLILKKNDNDSCWVILDQQTPDGNYYLVPKANLIIGDRIYQTIEYIFTCRGYENKSSNKFKLVHPAEVKFNRNEYELLKSGELRFEQN